jgi:hypothetical protein
MVFDAETVFLSHTFYSSRDGVEIGPVTFVNDVHGLLAYFTSKNLQILSTKCTYMPPIIHRIRSDHYCKHC